MVWVSWWYFGYILEYVPVCVFGECKVYLHWELFCWLYLFEILICNGMCIFLWCYMQSLYAFCIYVHICKYVGMQWYSMCILYTHIHCGLNLFKFCEDTIVALFMPLSLGCGCISFMSLYFEGLLDKKGQFGVEIRIRRSFTESWICLALKSSANFHLNWW